MSTVKNVLKSYQNITAGAMANTDTVVSAVTNIQNLDNIAFQFNYSGTPTGTFAIQVSLDYNQDQNGNVITAGTWFTLAAANFTQTITNPTGSAGTSMASLKDLPFPWIRASYTNASGTGTLNGWISGKSY